MNFSEWRDELSYDEQAALCKYDVWAGAIDTAVKKLREERETLLLHKLNSHATGVNGCIEILEEMLKD